MSILALATVIGEWFGRKKIIFLLVYTFDDGSGGVGGWFDGTMLTRDS